MLKCNDFLRLAMFRPLFAGLLAQNLYTLEILDGRDG